MLGNVKTLGACVCVCRHYLMVECFKTSFLLSLITLVKHYSTSFSLKVQH